MRRDRIAIFGSLFLHGVLFAAVTSQSQSPSQTSSRVAMRIVDAPAVAPAPATAVAPAPPSVEQAGAVERPRAPRGAPPKGGEVEVPRGAPAGEVGPLDDSDLPPSNDAPASAGSVAGGGVRDLGGLELTPKSAPPPPDPGRLVLVPPSSPPPPPDPVIEPAGGGAYVYRDSAFSARIEYDGTVKFEDEGLGPLGLQHRGLGASFDFTDAIIRGQGDDPYRFEKARMLDRTRAFRADLAAAACEERLRESIFALRGRLVKIWSNGAMPVEQRRALLFAVWDECAEEGDAELLRHAEMARATVLGFIQSNLPEGSVNAYPVAELRALDARRMSRQRFEPYASEEPPG